MNEGRLGCAVGTPRRVDVYISGALAIALVAGSIAFFITSEQRSALTVLLAAEIAGGREASLPTGLAAGLDWPTAALAATLIELTSLFLLFPLLVALATGLHKVRRLESLLSRAQDYARRNPEVDVLALGGLTLMPFLPVGALTSVLIGELLRLPSRYLLPTMVAALLIGNFATAYATKRLISLFPHPTLVAGIMGGLVLVGAAVAWLVHRDWGARQQKTRDMP